ncbi:MAG: AAA family ATPase [Sandaracinaceae bacterium]
MERAPDNPFVGREDASQQLRDTLDRARLVTVGGAPGIGKSRFVAEATPALERRGERIYVDLTGMRGAAAVVRAVATRLAMIADEPDALDALSARVGYALAARSASLLVLDNAEACAPELATLWTEWSVTAPALRAIVTSRVQLRVPGERWLALGPLDEPDARALLLARATEAAPDRAWGDEDAGPLLARLDGVPLAIELAAARLRALSMSELAERLAERGEVLARGYRGGLGRHDSLAAAMDASYELLDPRAREAWATLALSRASFTLADADERLGTDALEAVEDLLEASLLRRRGASFDMLSPVRAYGAARFDELPDRDARLDRFVGWVLSHESPDLDDLDRVAELGLERGRLDDAIRARVAWAERASGSVPVADIGEALRAIDARARDEPSRASASTEVGLLDAIAQYARLAGDAAGARVAAERANTRAEADGDGDARAAASRVSAQVAFYDGDSARASVLAARAAEIATSTVQRLRALASLAAAHHVAGELEAARAAYQEAVDGAREVGAARIEASALSNLGFWSIEVGAFDAAEAQLTRALALYEALGDRRACATARGFLGNLRREERRTREARELYDDAYAELVRLGDRGRAAVVRMDLGILALDAGDPDVAQAHLRGALSEVGEAELPRLHALTNAYLVAASAIRGERAFAEERLAAARAWAPRLAGVEEVIETCALHLQLERDLDREGARGLLAGLGPPAAGHAAIARRILVARAQALAPPDDVWVLDVDGRRVSRGDRVIELGGHDAVFRIAVVLARAHASEPGAAVSHGALLEAGWPGERIDARAAKNRLRVAIAFLRRAGIDEIETARGGYRMTRGSILLRGA